MSALTPEQEQEIARIVATAVSSVLDSRDRIDRTTHTDDHLWVQLQRAREQKWNDTVEKIKLSVLGAMAIAVLGLTFKFLAFVGSLVLAAMQVKNGGG